MFTAHRAATLAFLTCTVLLAGSAGAQTTSTTKPTSTTTTSTSTSTTTTMHPHRFSPETRACINDAKQAYRQCPGTKEDCFSQYQKAFAQCFAAGDGVKCATKCESNLSKCLTAVPTTRSKCVSTCKTNRRKDTAACRLIAEGEAIWTGGDQGCLATKDLAFALCKFQCSEATQVCHTNFKFCIANCPNQ